MKTAHNKSQNRSKLFRILVFVFGIYLGFRIWDLGFTKGVFAQERLPLVVAPARQQLAIDPGKSESSIIKFFNESNVPVSGTLKAVDFIVTGNEGKTVLLENTLTNSLPAQASKYSGSAWVKLPYDRATIPAGNVLRVQFNVNVPKNALPGGRYVAIYFEQTGFNVGVTAAALQSGESTVTPRIVGLVNIKVSGPVTEGAIVREFSAPKFLEFGPIEATTEIFNSGNYHITPKGQISLTDFMARKIAVVPLEEKNVFPESSRIYKNEVGAKLLIGKFKLTLAVTYGETNQALIANTYVWVFPWKLALAIILGVVIIILAGRQIWKSLKGKEKKLEAVLKEEISEVEELKEKYQDRISDGVSPKEPKP